MDLNEIVDVVMTLEAALGIEIADSEAAAIKTVGDLYRAATKAANGPGGATPTEVWEALVSILEMNGNPPERIKPETGLQDLLALG